MPHPMSGVLRQPFRLRRSKNKMFINDVHVMGLDGTISPQVRVSAPASGQTSAFGSLLCEAERMLSTCMVVQTTTGAFLLPRLEPGVVVIANDGFGNTVGLLIDNRRTFWVLNYVQTIVWNQVQQAVRAQGFKFLLDEGRLPTCAYDWSTVQQYSY